jgi:hypothetical protein
MVRAIGDDFMEMGAMAGAFPPAVRVPAGAAALGR